MSAPFLDEIARVFAERGGQRYGEDVSLLDHSLQCAWLAHEDGAGDPLIAAALLHDFGHLLVDGGDEFAPEDDARHEIHGARALRRWFGPEIVGPIALHVQAKRYLCAVEPDYADRLSPASILSLNLQGGPLTTAQCRGFARNRFSSDATRLRRWDDAGKVTGRLMPSLEQYWPMLERLALAH